MGLEVVQIQVGAPEGVLGIARDIRSYAVLAGDEVFFFGLGSRVASAEGAGGEGRVLGRVVDTCLVQLVPYPLCMVC